MLFIDGSNGGHGRYRLLRAFRFNHNGILTNLVTLLLAAILGFRHVSIHTLFF